MFKGVNLQMKNAAGYPLLPYAVAFVVGTAIGLASSCQSVFLPYLPYGSIALLCLFSFSPLLQKGRAFRFFCLTCRVFSVFLFAYAFSILRDTASDDAFDLLYSRASGENRKLYVSGEICALRDPVAASYGEYKYRFRLKDPSIRESTNELFSAVLPDSIAVVWYGRPASKGGFEPVRGARWEIKGKVCLRRYAKPGERDINSLFVVSRASATHVLGSSEEKDFLSILKDSAASILSRGLDSHPEEKSLILAMTLGLRAELSRDLTKDFRKAGTIHIFAISGLHVVVVAGILAFALGCLGIPRHRWVLFLTPFIVFYVLLTGAPSSAMRAGLMVILYYMAPFFKRRPSPLNTLSVTVIVLLLVSPMQLRELGFILSFSMVLGLILCAGPFVRLAKALFHVEALRERMSLEDGGARGEGFAEKAKYKVRHAAFWFVESFADTLGVSIAAALISLPLTAFYFDMFVPFSILANIIVVPISGYVMLSAAFALLAACLAQPLAVPFNLLAALGAWMMKRMSQWVASLPGASPRIVFPLWALVVWYAALAALTWILRRNLADIGNISEKKPENEADSLTSEI